MSINEADIVAKTALELYPGSEYTWKDHGLKLEIPENALKSNTSQAMSIQASLSGHYQLPDNMELVSGVYWFIFPGKFSRPVMLELQHCTSLHLPDDSLSLSFISAYNMPDALHHEFHPLPGGTFPKESRYAMIELSQVSGMGIGIGRRGEEGRGRGERGWGRLCTAQTYYMAESATRWLAHIVIGWDLDLYMKVCWIRKYIYLNVRVRFIFYILQEMTNVYAKRRAEVGTKVHFILPGHEIALDIPDSGIKYRSGWSMQPLVEPKVRYTILH